MIRHHCCDSVIAANAARPFRHPAPIFNRPQVKTLLSSLPRAARVLEVGAGCLRNSLFLQDRGLRVVVVEVAGVRSRFKAAYMKFPRSGGRFIEWEGGSSRLRWRGPYDIVTTFVVETVCRPRARLSLLRACRAALRRGGTFIIAVRGVADVVTAHASGVSCSDGYLTLTRTFARSFTRRQLAAVLRRAGFASIEFLHGAKTMEPEYLYALAQR